MNTGKFLIGILTGVAAGALLGVLLAPDKGGETRRRMFDKSNNYVRGLRNKFNNFKNSWGTKDQYARENEFREEMVSPSI